MHVHSGYNAWGLVDHQYPIPTNSDSYHKFGFNARWGYVTDASTGLSYCQNRYYDPATGRFLTRDPIGYEGGANLYGYCGGNPVKHFDRLGWTGGDGEDAAIIAELEAEAAEAVGDIQAAARAERALERALGGSEEPCATPGEFLSEGAGEAEGLGIDNSEPWEAHHKIPRAIVRSWREAWGKEGARLPERLNETVDLPRSVHRSFHGRGGGWYNNWWKVLIKEAGGPKKVPIEKLLEWLDEINKHIGW